MSSSKNAYETISIPVKKITMPKGTSDGSKALDPETEKRVKATLVEAQEQRAQIIAKANQEREKVLADIQIELEKATKEVAELKQRAAKEVEELKQKAYDEAFEEGYDQGFNKGEKEAKMQFTEKARIQLENLKQTCQQAQRESELYIDEVVPQLVALMKQISEKVTMQAMEDSETKLLPLIKAQLKELSRRKQLFIRVHPDSYEDIKQYEEQLQEFCVEAKLHFIPDETLSEFGCVIESESEIIDLQLDKQLNQLFTEFERVVKEQ